MIIAGPYGTRLVVKAARKIGDDVMGNVQGDES
jgi:hypothetical protein